MAPPKVPFHSNFAANSIVIDSAGRTLYFILSPSEAYQYPISVGREGFSWTGTEVISRQQAWPDWHPPKEMIARDPRLPDKMTGGLKNPLGALALYLGNTLYRIHGTNDPKSIGQAASSGCFRMMNEHVLHLASLAGRDAGDRRQAPADRRPCRPHPRSRRWSTRRAEEDDPYAARRIVSATTTIRRTTYPTTTTMSRALRLATSTTIATAIRCSAAGSQKPSRKPTGPPCAAPMISPSHITRRPRTKVPTGQPLTRLPS